MNPARLSCVLLAVTLCGAACFVYGQEPSLSDLDALTQQWIGLRSTLSEEKRLWVRRKTAWEGELELLEEQKRVLGKEVEATRDRLTSAEERRADVVARRERAEQELEEIDTVLTQAVEEARQVARAVPEPLFQQLPSELQAFGTSKGAEVLRAQRAQRLVAFLSTIESMQNRFHAVQQTLETDAGRRQVEVLYMGLARGFAVSPGNDWAAVGTPGDAGWTWTSEGLNPVAVRQLLDVYHRRQTAMLVPVPVAVEEAP